MLALRYAKIGGVLLPNWRLLLKWRHWESWTTPPTSMENRGHNPIVATPIIVHKIISRFIDLESHDWSIVSIGKLHGWLQIRQACSFL